MCVTYSASRTASEKEHRQETKFHFTLQQITVAKTEWLEKKQEGTKQLSRQTSETEN